MHELVVQHLNERVRHARAATDVDRAAVEAGGRKAEEAREAAVEERRIPDRDGELARRPERERAVQAIVGRLELAQHVLLELARAVEPRRLVEVDVLEEQEVEGLAPGEAAVGAFVSDREGPARIERRPREHHEGQQGEAEGSAVRSSAGGLHGRKSRRSDRSSRDAHTAVRNAAAVASQGTAPAVK